MMTTVVLLSWLPWIVAAVVAPLWYLLLFGPVGFGRVLSRISTYWFPIGLIALVYVMAGGQLGASLGIPALFRDDPASGFNINSRAFWGAFAATWLIGQVWLMIYVHGYISRPALLDDTPRLPGWDPFRLWILPSSDVREFQDWRSPVQFLAACTPPFLLVLLLVGGFPADVPGGPKWDAQRALTGLLEYGGGILAGMLVIAVILRLSWGSARVLGHSEGFRNLVAWTGGILRSGSLETTIPTGSTPALAAAGTGAFWSFLVATAIAVVLPLVFKFDFIVPSLAISLLLGVIVALYFVLVSLRPSLQLPFVLILMGYITWSNSGAYKYRFPHMGGPDGGSYYDAANLVPAATTTSSTPPALPLLDDTAVLNAWRAQTGEDRPKLVLLAVTGGAYRAAFWTAAVLDALQERSGPDGPLPGLTDRIRVITGASGGMVGAAYFATTRSPDGTPVPVLELLEAEASRRSCEPSRYPSSPDSLTPIVQQLIQRDIPMIFCPVSYQRVDRGVVLDRQWCTLERPVSSLRDGEAAGWRPSLIVSPMIIETGERLLISNLDLSAIAQPESVTRTPYLRSARQLFHMLPESQPTFHLSTAIRMNATFPYASPAVSLPTAPPLRVVDAGYYDNYGVNLAAAWAYQNRHWLQAYTSGVALIQIYAYPLVQPGTAPADGAVSPGEAGADTLGQAFEWLTSPIEGGLAARNLSMLYRNEEQLSVLDDAVNTPGEQPAFFERFAFAYPGGAAMNWFLTRENLQDMRDSIAGREGARGATAANREQLDRLVAWWNGRVPKAEAASPLAAPYQTKPDQVPAQVP